MLLIWLSERPFMMISMVIQIFSFKKIYCKVPAAKWQLFHLHPISWKLLEVVLTNHRVQWCQLKHSHIPDSKVHRVNMGPIWGRQDPGGPHVGPMEFAICEGRKEGWNECNSALCPILTLMIAALFTWVACNDSSHCTVVTYIHNDEWWI